MATKQILLNVLYSDILTILVNAKRATVAMTMGPFLYLFFFTVHLIFLCSLMLYSYMALSICPQNVVVAKYGCLCL